MEKRTDIFGLLKKPFAPPPLKEQTEQRLFFEKIKPDIKKELTNLKDQLTKSQSEQSKLSKLSKEEWKYIKLSKLKIQIQSNFCTECKSL